MRAQPHGARQPHGRVCSGSLAPVPALVSTIHNIYEGGPLLDGRLSADQRAGGPHDHHQPGRGRPLRGRADRARDAAHGDPQRRGHGADAESCRPRARAALRGAMSVGDQRVRLAGGRDGSRSRRTIPTCCVRSLRVRAREPRAVLVIVGQGSLQAETEALTAELGLREAVRFLGSPRRRAGRHERGRRLRDVLRVGGHADGAARGRGGRPADRRHGRSGATTKWCGMERAGSWCRPGTPRRWRRRCCG